MNVLFSGRYCDDVPSLANLNRNAASWPLVDPSTSIPQLSTKMILEHDQVTFQCVNKARHTSDENGYEASLECENDGTWDTSEVEQCVLDKECTNPYSLSLPTDIVMGRITRLGKLVVFPSKEKIMLD